MSQYRINDVVWLIDTVCVITNIWVSTDDSVVQMFDLETMGKHIIRDVSKDRIKPHHTKNLSDIANQLSEL